MCSNKTSISLWFVCRLCRGSFGQVDAFIEHKKQKHFTQFQNTTCIFFEERDLSLFFPVIPNGDLQIQNETNAPPIKIEVTDEENIFPFSSEITDEPNLAVVEPKSELIIYKCEPNPDHENKFVGLKQPEQSPFVLLKRLTTEEIQSARVPQHNFRLLAFEQENLTNSSEPLDSFNANSFTIDHIEVENEKSTENELPAAVRNVSTEDDLQFECKLCSKKLESDANLKIHVGICALSHEDRNRFCVICNRKFSSAQNLKHHSRRFHGTEEEQLSLYTFKCHVCPKQYRHAIDLTFHLESHKKKKQQVGTSKSKSHKCSQPNCGKEFTSNQVLRRHMAAVHLGARPYSCNFPNCCQSFSYKGHLKIHLRIHTGERPYKCTVNNCNEAFITSGKRSIHHRRVHCNL